MKIPAGMPPQQAEALLAYMQANPEVAKAANKQALQMLKSPGLAQQFMNMQVRCMACMHAGGHGRDAGSCCPC